MKIYRTTEIEELLLSASYALTQVNTGETTTEEFGEVSMGILSELVASVQGILSHEAEVY